MPSFTHESAQAIYDQLAPKPPAEPPRITAARALLERTPPEARDQVGAEVIRHARDAAEIQALHSVVREMLDVDAAATEDTFARQVTEA
jgi:hypothetical protein